MNPRLRRNTDVNDAVVEPLPPLAERAGAGEGFEALYRRTFPRVYAYVASLLHDGSAAEEVTAQAFERAYRRRRGFRASRGSMEAWLFGIARNAALDELRRLKRRGAVDVEAAAAVPAPEDDLELGLRRAAVRRALACLEPRERDLVALKFAAGLSNAEIARVLGISESNAGTRLHRTIEKLREACSDEL
jgi:RNA polymerase sigma-70 factor (ECF subfamily)